MKAAIRTSLMVCIALMSVRIFAQQKDWQSVAAGDPILQAMHAELERSKSQLKLDQVEADPFDPARLAFLAMTYHKLGQKEQAQKTLSQLRETAKDPASSYSEDEETQAFLREAEACLREKSGPAALFLLLNSRWEWLLPSAGHRP